MAPVAGSTAICAAAVGAFVVREAAFGADVDLHSEEERPATRRARLVLLDAHFLGSATQALRGRLRNARLHVLRHHDDRRAAHDDAARGKGAEALLHVLGRAMEDAADAVHRYAERIRRDLREHRLESLSVRRRARIDAERRIRIQEDARTLARA